MDKNTENKVLRIEVLKTIDKEPVIDLREHAKEWYELGYKHGFEAGKEDKKPNIAAFLNDFQKTSEKNKRHPRYIDAIKDIKRGLRITGIFELITEQKPRKNRDG